MILEKIYKEVENRITCIDFNKIWPNFKCYKFYIYDESYAYTNGMLISKPESFFANTSLEYNNDIVAIWNINDFDGDFDILTANLIHEMFHAFQKSNGDNRYPNDLDLLAYPNDDNIFQLKFNENKILSSIILNNSFNDLEKFIYIRSLREAKLGKIIENEYFAETIEGCAEYAGTMALQQINKDKYQTRIERYCSLINTPTKLLFDVRKISYYIGTLLQIVLEKRNVNFKIQSEKSIYNICKEIIRTNKTNIDINNEVSSFLNIYKESKKEKINIFLQKANKVVCISSEICGYDPMNMIRDNDFILCSHFVFLKENEKIINIMQPVLLHLENGSNIRIDKYYVLIEEGKVL